jgi:hypothetical protein
MARIRVLVKQTGQTGTVDDTEFDPNIFEQIPETIGLQSTNEGAKATDLNTGQSEFIQKLAGTQPATVPAETTIQTVKNPWGVSTDELQQAQLKALAAGDTKNATLFEKMLTIETGGADKKEAAKLRAEYSKETKATGFPEIQKQYKNVQSAGEGGAGDISVMYSYIKILDPNTAVREGELALAARAAGAPDNIIKAARKLDKGGAGLGPETRKQMIAEITSIYNNSAKSQKELSAFYTGLAIDSGADPKDVLGSMGEIELAEVPEVGEKEEEKGFLYKMLVEPYITTKDNLAALAQVGVSKAVGAVDPQAGAQLAQEGAFGEGAAKRSQMASENPVQALVDQAGASASIYGQASLLSRIAPTAGKFSAGRAGQLPGIKDKAAQQAARVAEGTTQTSKSKIISMIDKVREKTPKAIAGRKQAEAAARSTAKPIVKNFVKAGKDLASNDPDIAKEFAKQTKYLNKIDSVPKLLDRMQVWGRTAYLKGGGVKSAAKADLYDTLYKEGINQLKTLAPEVYENRQILRLTLEMPKAAGKALWKATLGRAAMGGL